MAWVDADGGGLYTQNIQPNGNMGPLPTGCPGPTGFRGEYSYIDEETYGTMLTWDRPEEEVDYYVVYRTDLATGEVKEVEFSGQDNYFFDPAYIGQFSYQLRVMWAYLDCGLSMPATTDDGQDHVTVLVTDIPETTDEPIVSVLNIYTLSGQRIQSKDLETLSKGIYLLEGLTADGKRIHRKFTVTE